MKCLAFAVFLACGCGHGSDSVRQAVTAIEKSEASAIGLFEKYDHDHQLEIARAAVAAGHPERGASELAAYRVRRDFAAAALRDAAALVSMGPVLLALVDHGLKKEADLDVWLKDVWEAAARMQGSLKALGIDVGGP